jgi:hypothetical protein
LACLEFVSKQLTGSQIAEQMSGRLEATVESTNYLEQLARSVKWFSLPASLTLLNLVAPHRR